MDALTFTGAQAQGDRRWPASTIGSVGCFGAIPSADDNQWLMRHPTGLIGENCCFYPVNGLFTGQEKLTPDLYDSGAKGRRRHRGGRRRASGKQCAARASATSDTNPAHQPLEWLIWLWHIADGPL